MTTHYVVESMSAYEAVRLQGAASWHTTSPAILDILSRKEEDVHSLDAGVPYLEADRLARAGYRFAEHYGEYLNQECRWRDHADLALIFGAVMAKLFHVIFYKAKALDALLNRVAPEKVVCVGDPDTVKVKGLNWTYNRFDTLYAYLASQVSLDRLSVLRHEIPPDDLRDSTRNAIPQRMGHSEKFMSLLNNTGSSFAFKLWRALRNLKLFPFDRISLTMFPRRTVYIYKTCELLEEQFLTFLRNGSRVGFLDKLPILEEDLFKQELLARQRIAMQAVTSMRESIAEEKLNWPTLFNTAASGLAERLCDLLCTLYTHMGSLTKGFDSVLYSLKPKSIILTNALNLPLERFFYCHCVKFGIPVVAFEHGITLGLSEFADWSVRHSGMKAADGGIYHNKQAFAAMNFAAPKQIKAIAGLPRTTTKPKFPTVQRWLARRWLSIAKNERVIAYVADGERNNYIYGPYAENDLQFKEKTETLIAHLSKANPEACILLKLYPADRYIDKYRFEWLASEFPNVKIVRDMDFRFIRMACDVIVGSSSQSSLGWVCGAGVQVFFVEFNWAPTRITGEEVQNNWTDGIRRIVKPDIAALGFYERPKTVMSLLGDMVDDKSQFLQKRSVTINSK